MASSNRREGTRIDRIAFDRCCQTGDFENAGEKPESSPGAMACPEVVLTNQRSSILPRSAPHTLPLDFGGTGGKSYRSVRRLFNVFRGFTLRQACKFEVCEQNSFLLRDLNIDDENYSVKHQSS